MSADQLHQIREALLLVGLQFLDRLLRLLLQALIVRRELLPELLLQQLLLLWRELGQLVRGNVGQL